MKSHPGGVAFSGQARVVDAAAELALNEAVQALSREKYGWGDGLVVELTPVFSLLFETALC